MNMMNGKKIVLGLGLVASLMGLTACHGSAWDCHKPAPVVVAIPPEPEPTPVEPPPAAPLCEAEPVQVYFDTNKFELTSGSSDDMKRLAHCLAKNTTQKVKIEGHADKRGSVKHNLALSQKRADFVKRFLLLNYAPEWTITEVVGLGATEEFGAGNSAEALAKNRTTTVTVMR